MLLWKPKENLLSTFAAIDEIIVQRLKKCRWTVNEAESLQLCAHADSVIVSACMNTCTPSSAEVQERDVQKFRLAQHLWKHWSQPASKRDHPQQSPTVVLPDLWLQIIRQEGAVIQQQKTRKWKNPCLVSLRRSHLLIHVCYCSPTRPSLAGWMLNWLLMLAPPPGRRKNDTNAAKYSRNTFTRVPLKDTTLLWQKIKKITTKHVISSVPEKFKRSKFEVTMDFMSSRPA